MVRQVAFEKRSLSRGFNAREVPRGISDRLMAPRNKLGARFDVPAASDWRVVLSHHVFVGG